MISSKKQLKDCLHVEKNIYMDGSRKTNLILKFTNEQRTKVWKFIKLLRKTEYYKNKINKSLLCNKIIFYLYRRYKNGLGMKLGIEIYENCFDKGLKIYHSGNIIVNRNCKIGKNCTLHGANCIGNNGKNEACPILGDNVTLGVGAKIIGDIYIANGITIGANAIVNKSFYEEGITIAGVPAKKIKEK